MDIAAQITDIVRKFVGNFSTHWNTSYWKLKTSSSFKSPIPAQIDFEQNEIATGKTCPIQ